jgi:hypothetical protein
VRALLNASEKVPQACFESAWEYLLNAQLKDGSWPSSPEERRGSWVTSLVCSVLTQDRKWERSVETGLEWLCQDYPRNSALWRRLLRKLRGGSEKLAEQNDSLNGWGWTPQTSSWVEPTAFALLALRDAPESWRPSRAESRREIGVEVLYDRVCAKGGWNCGNPKVYGVEGEPLVLPTSWALLALQHEHDKDEKWRSLSWLFETYPQIVSPTSSAVARITLETYGIQLPKNGPRLEKLFGTQDFLRMTQTVSWTCLALSPKRAWFPRRGGKP